LSRIETTGRGSSSGPCAVAGTTQNIAAISVAKPLRAVKVCDQIARVIAVPLLVKGKHRHVPIYFIHGAAFSAYREVKVTNSSISRPLESSGNTVG
jgi:hypothetical protein